MKSDVQSVSCRIRPRAARQATNSKAEAPAAQPQAPISDRYESIGLTGEDLTEDNRIPVLLTFPDEETGKVCKDCTGISDDDRYDLPLVNGFSAYLTPDKVDGLMDLLPEGVELAINKKIRYPQPIAVLAKSVEDADGNPMIKRLPGIEKVWERGFTGKGQTVAVIDSGIYKHPDLKDKVVEWVDFSREKRKTMVDPFGHGTHVAGVLAGNGTKSNGKVKGVAPDANLVGLRITTVAEAIRALQWVIEHKDEHNIKVVNMSLGDFAAKSYKNDPWAQAAQKAIDAGLVVVVAAGNEGPDGKTISTPGINPQAITVGAYDDKGTPDTSDDSVASFSSRGPTVDGLSKPDVLAPGVGIFGPLSPGSNMDVPDFPHIGKDYLA
ncbi:MAG: S8 family peptidase, partial [Candidatus Eremiobacteraeota bacterium]|nr:S8 family peptidase [Candidatus Eremiobacteraeota bacterium]